MPRERWPANDSVSHDSGDVFLRAGQWLMVNAGQLLVLEHASALVQRESATPLAQGLVTGTLVRAARPH